MAAVEGVLSLGVAALVAWLLVVTRRSPVLIDRVIWFAAEPQERFRGFVKLARNLFWTFLVLAFVMLLGNGAASFW